MGIGVSLAFMAIGAILAFAIDVDLSGLNITAVGLILMLVGAVSMGFTLMYTRPRRRAGAGQDQVVHTDPTTGSESASTPTETVIREERIIEHPQGRVDHLAGTPLERVKRPDPGYGSRPSLDPSVLTNPETAQDPASQNVMPDQPQPRRPHERE